MQSGMPTTIPRILVTRQGELCQKHHPESHHPNMREEFLTRTSFSKFYGWNNKVMQLAQHREWPQQWHLARV
jgi:hypothetical protein